ncbi:MAG: LacI family transcriptional regulator [Treponema sp.]|jgi:LacI family transcriptional regulator|nr:LacI family transcriptional regulator [Treponema sp.]
MNISDIAKQIGVSPSMVSRALNGKKYVNAGKREKILKLMEETGYVPNKAARNMVMQRSFTIGIVIPDGFNVFQRQLVSIIERDLCSFDYHTLIFLVKFGSASEKDCLDRIKSEKLDGIIMLHEIKSPEFYEYLDKTQLPVISTACNYNAIPTVKVDDRLAAFEAINHLIGLGHRKINLICGDEYSFGKKRAEGYFQALNESGIPGENRRVVYVPQYSPESGMYGMRELLLRNRDFTAIFAASDELALGAMRTLHDGGIRVPEDISVIGFDDIDIADYLHPRLTTIRQPIREIGEQSALNLHRHITGGSASFQELIIPHKLIVRESTARVS